MMKFETKAIHAGQEADKETGAVIVPVYQTSTYKQELPGKHKGFEYSRTGNPTRAALEKAIAELEEGKYGLAFASGLAATNTVFNLLEPGDRLVCGDDLYGGTFRLAEKVFKRYGIDVVYASVDSLDSFSKACNEKTKMIWIETPTNPLLKIIDIAALAKIAHKNKALLAVDNTFASPYFQRPLTLGADIVLHSTTKYIGGHSDTVGGAVVTNNQEAYAAMKYHQNAAGGVPGPWDCWLMMRGMKTMAVRMRQHEANALAIAKYLEQHKKVTKVYYPGLKSNPQYKLAKKQMSGFSGMLSFVIAGDFKQVEKFISKLKIFMLAESLGGVESLICYPPKMTHAFITPEKRKERGISDNMVRLSVGIEHVDDLIADLENALK